jgi:hypothetical protein
MLHMLVNTHNPESCAYRGEAEDEALVGALEAIKGHAPEQGLEWRGSWVNARRMRSSCSWTRPMRT